MASMYTDRNLKCKVMTPRFWVRFSRGEYGLGSLPDECKALQMPTPEWLHDVLISKWRFDKPRSCTLLKLARRLHEHVRSLYVVFLGTQPNGTWLIIWSCKGNSQHSLNHSLSQPSDSSQGWWVFQVVRWIFKLKGCIGESRNVKNSSKFIPGRRDVKTS